MAPAKWHLVTGRVVPERQRFQHEGRRLYSKNPDSGIEICLIFGVVDNQLIAKIIGEIGAQSNAALCNCVRQAENIVLNIEAFTSGRVFELDIVGIMREKANLSDGSMEFHYLDNHEFIADRVGSLDASCIWELCIHDDGLPLRMCLNDLRMALKEQNDAPFYCYRAVETIKNHVAFASHDNDKLQWEVTRDTLGVEKAKVMTIKKLADPLRHGKSIRFTGAEWRNIVLIAWEITEAYMKWRIEVANRKPTVA